MDTHESPEKYTSLNSYKLYIIYMILSNIRLYRIQSQISYVNWNMLTLLASVAICEFFILFVFEFGTVRVPLV